MNKAVYIGAGTDLVPVIIIDNIKEFIYIDSQPFSEFGTHAYDEITHISSSVEKKDRHENAFSRKYFLENLHKVMNQISFKLINSNDDYLIFTKDDRSLKYYYSCAFPDYIDNNIIEDIKTCDTIIMVAHDPHNKIFEYLQKPINFIGDIHTIYKSNKNDDNYERSAFRYILENPNMIKKYYIMKEKKEYEWWENKNQVPELKLNFDLIECKNLNEIKEMM
jgi:hypothetical protein